ncbi:hypothetical protein [Chitinimonas sp. BJYL2]|uniref:glycine-rich domain-containing protein n=1 Tax=Chitinimonas sp. BJYL2 TaxID=2976696 RepID=UPI0022B48BC0|nr:hypothetical protein [Chitinimonas sp. BJYL2]
MPIFILILLLIVGFVLWFAWSRSVNAQRAEFIRHYTLPQGLYAKLQQKHPQLSLKDCQLVGQGLRQFFLAYLRGGGQYISMPSQVVDDLWHEFILHTRNYEHFCNKAFGRFLHHTPATSLGDDRPANAGLRRCWQLVCREELIDPLKPSRLPLLFALDKKLQIVNGFHYLPDCQGISRAQADSSGSAVHCGSDFSSTSYDGSTDGLDGNDGSGGGDGDGGGGCGGGCGGGGD